MKPTQKPLLKQMDDGEFFPCEAIVPRDPAYTAVCEEAIHEEKNLYDRLSAEDKAHYEKLAERTTSLTAMSDYANFAYDFRSGMRLMQELLASDEV